MGSMDVPDIRSARSGDGTVPLLFFFRDHDANQLMIVSEQ
jgi:hypothetical protein